MMTATERCDWLAERRTCITATDVRRMVLPYEDSDPPQAALIFDEKTSPGLDRPASPLMELGLLTEDLNARLYEKATGQALRLPRDAVTRHPLHPWIGASLDRITEGDDPVELKYTPFFNDSWGPEGTDHVPLGYVIQTTWQMLVTGRSEMPLSVITGTGQHRIYRIGLVDGLAGALIDIARDLWGFVELGQRPDDNWIHPASLALGDELVPFVQGKAIDLGPEGWALANVYKTNKAAEAEAKAAAEVARNQLLAMMGDAQKATAGTDYKLSRCTIAGAQVSYYRQPHDRLTVTDVTKKKGKS